MYERCYTSTIWPAYLRVEYVSCFVMGRIAGSCRRV